MDAPQQRRHAERQQPLPWGVACKLYLRGLTPKDIREFHSAITSLRQINSLRSLARLSVGVVTMAGTGVILADDITVIGIANDPLLAVSAAVIARACVKIRHIRNAGVQSL